MDIETNEGRTAMMTNQARIKNGSRLHLIELTLVMSGLITILKIWPKYDPIYGKGSQEKVTIFEEALLKWKRSEVRLDNP